MTQPFQRDPVRAVRRAAIEAFSHTALSANPAVLAAHEVQGGPGEVDRALILHATSLADAFAALANMPYGDALDALCKAAQVVAEARITAMATWVRTCKVLGGQNLPTQLAFLSLETKDEAITAYAVAADITYEQACQLLYVLHGTLCKVTCSPPNNTDAHEGEA